MVSQDFKSTENWPCSPYINGWPNGVIFPRDQNNLYMEVIMKDTVIELFRQKRTLSQQEKKTLQEVTTLNLSGLQLDEIASLKWASHLKN